MVDVDKMTDAELRTKLLEFGFPVMPITGTTRKLMAKKLKILLENDNKVTANDGRRSLGRYSSEEDSDPDNKPLITKKDKNRRATMAAPLAQPPLSRKSQRFVSPPNEEEVRVDKKISKPVKVDTHDDFNTSRKVLTSTTRTHRIVKAAQDEFDTGSESESDIAAKVSNNVEYKRGPPIKSSTNYSPSPVQSPRFSPVKKSSFESLYSRTASTSSTAPTSPSRLTSYGSPSTSASDYASEKLNQIRSRLSLNTNSGFDRPLYSPPLSTEKLEKEETPFLSNFTRRLSAMSTQKRDLEFKNDIIKEHDTNGSSAFAKSHLNSFRSTRGRDANYDYKSNQNSILKTNFVSFAVLAGAALFFILLGILYLGMTSDTSMVTSGFSVPYCKKGDVMSKTGINCVIESEVSNAVHLLDVLKPELTRRAVANKCFDKTIKAHMTESEIVNFCLNNFGIKDEYQIRNDLRNLEILVFSNPSWGVQIAQKDTNNGHVLIDDISKNMEQVVFNYATKVTSFVILEPNLPWKCTFYNTFNMIFNAAIAIGIMIVVFYASNLAYKYYKHYEQKQKDEIGFMVEQIIDMLQTNAAEDPENQFLVINHIRDMILSVADRKHKEKIWTKAVKFIEENESRIRTEIQVVQGEPYDVWRWIGSPSLNLSGSPRNKSWQGQAFETQVGSVNSLPCSPTPCIKIRGMVEDGDRNTHMIKEAVLSKCGSNCRILHCAVETVSNCVYLKCADTSDAAVAYRNLHGWWYAGQLVTVKYLRLERYMQRFPDSPLSGPPFLKSIAPVGNWAS